MIQYSLLTIQPLHLSIFEVIVMARCGYFTNAKVESVLAKAKESQSQYLLSPYGAELGRTQIVGRRFEVSNNVPSSLTKGSGSNL